MKFIKNGEDIGFDNFLKIFPLEAACLKAHLEEDYTFTLEGERISLNYGDYKPVFINIESKLSYHKGHFYKNSIYKEPISRAIGLKKGENSSRPYVLDATAGMMGDSLLLYSLGLKGLDVAERHPVVSALISNALRLSRLSINFISQSSELIEEKFLMYDVVFYDPMYAHGANKKAAPKKEMIIFRDIVGVDEDSESVAINLLAKIKIGGRLVIKRSIKAQALISNPTFSISGKSTRYDVYLK